MYIGNTSNVMFISSGVLLLMSLHTTVAQRPSFAGSRPPGGLNQKDKYLITQQNTLNDSVDIANRFGGAQSDAVTVAYGASQRPPVGVPLVYPESNYVSLPSSTSPTLVSPQFAINNRIGEETPNISQQVPRQPQGATATASAMAGAGTPGRPNNPLPLDAHGDLDLISQLSRLPVDKQPFWFINYQAIETQRNSTRPSGGAVVETRGSFFG